tara:strand:+ start:445 stop:1368 length:924 start_codon:yes stop_codon:yes gene_type:complete
MMVSIPDRFLVEEDVSRADQFISEAFSIPRSLVKKYCKDGCFLINNVPLKPSTALSSGTEVCFQRPETVISDEIETSSADDSLYSLDIEYEDDALLVIYKPAGVVVHPGVKTKATLLDELLRQYPSLQSVGESHRSGIVHRLDRETEGLMVVAKTDKSYQSLTQQFKERTVEKGYYAMVYGDLEEDEIIIDKPIGRHRKFRIKYSVSDAIAGSEKEAITELFVVKRYGTKTLVDLKPKTGRTHQLRVHMEYIGHPILSDPLYGPKKGKLDGQLLQSYSLSFLHPVTENRLSFSRQISDRLLRKNIIR